MYDKGIEAFLAVASCRTIGGAAQLLNLTSSAISHRLRNLEEELDMILIDRHKGVRKSSLTMAGEKFLPVAERWNQLWRETRQIKNDVESLSLIIGSVDSVNTFIMPPIYKALSSHSPPVYLKIYTNRSQVMYEKIERKEIDVAFVVQETPYQYIELTPFLTEQMRVIRLNQSNLPPVVLAKDLQPEHELFINWGPSYQIWHEHIWNPLCRPKIELDSVTLIQAMIDDPRHWAIVPKSVLKYFRYNKKLIAQTLDPPLPDRVTYMITHRYPRIGARQAIDILKQLSKENGYLKGEDGYG
ncbi:MAG: LysR family transcriptional regulator [Pseudomonadota bacterium]